MKRLRNKIVGPALVSLMVLFLLLPLKGYAISGNVSIGPQQGTFDQGGTYNVYIAISGSEAFSFSGSISVSGGGSFAGADASLQSDGGTLIIAPTATSIAGNIKVAVGGTGSVTIAVNGTMLSADTGESTNVSGSVSVPIRSTADREAAEAAARAASEAEAARQASIWAEESSRQASIQAEQDAINASIYEEQSRQASIEAEAAAAYNSSVAESASIEESKALESASIQESIEEESKRAEREASIEEWQSKMESSRVEATRAFLENGVYYVPYDVEVARARFLFAVDTTETEAPQHFKKTALTVNTQPVLAYKLDGFSENIYIVYGCYDNGNDKPAFYLYDAKTDRLFPYEALGTLTPSEEGDSENAEEESTEEQTGRKGPGLFAAILSCFLSMILGAAILMLILTLLKKKQEDGGEEKGIVPFVPFSFGKNAEDASAPETETAQEVTEAAGALSVEEEADILSLEAEDPAEDAVDELLESVSMEIGKGEEEHPND